MLQPLKTILKPLSLALITVVLSVSGAYAAETQVAEGTIEEVLGSRQGGYSKGGSAPGKGITSSRGATARKSSAKRSGGCAKKGGWGGGSGSAWKDSSPCAQKKAAQGNPYIKKYKGCARKRGNCKKR